MWWGGASSKVGTGSCPFDAVNGSMIIIGMRLGIIIPTYLIPHNYTTYDTWDDSKAG